MTPLPCRLDSSPSFLRPSARHRVPGLREVQVVVASPRASAQRGEAPIVVALTSLLTIVSLVPPGGVAIAAGVAAFAFNVIAWQRRAPGASSLGLLFVTCLALALTGIGPQQVVFGLAFAVYALVASRVPWFREATCWLSVGRLDGRLVGFECCLCCHVRCDAPAVARHSPPRSRRSRPDLHPDWPLRLLVPAALVFSVVNAAAEEAAYRGVVFGDTRAHGPGDRHDRAGAGPSVKGALSREPPIDSTLGGAFTLASTALTRLVAAPPFRHCRCSASRSVQSTAHASPAQRKAGAPSHEERRTTPPD
jgi:hypothetical protein